MLDALIGFGILIAVIVTSCFLISIIGYIRRVTSDEYAMSRQREKAYNKKLTPKIILIAENLGKHNSGFSYNAYDSGDYIFVGKSFSDRSIATVYCAKESGRGVVYDCDTDREQSVNAYLPGEWESVLESLIPKARVAQQASEQEKLAERKARFGL